MKKHILVFIFAIAITSISYGQEMVRVSGGKFKMGYPNEKYDLRETPAHEVELDDYYISKYPVTVADFSKFISSTNYKTDAEKNGNEKGSFVYNEKTAWHFDSTVTWKQGVTAKESAKDNNPVVHVSWNDAMAYCEWLSKTTGKHYRLPTEAEWEYAARGGAQSKGYEYSGSNNIDEVAWYDGNSEKKLHPVGSKKANELGIFDMSGNVWEWCYDFWNKYEEKENGATSEKNPKGPETGISHILRGGAFFHLAQFCRVANRYQSKPTYRSAYYGFRIVCDAK